MARSVVNARFEDGVKPYLQDNRWSKDFNLIKTKRTQTNLMQQVMHKWQVSIQNIKKYINALLYAVFKMNHVLYNTAFLLFKYDILKNK